MKRTLKPEYSLGIQMIIVSFTKYGIASLLHFNKKSLKNMNSECFKDKYKLIDCWMLWLRNMEPQEQSKKEM